MPKSKKFNKKTATTFSLVQRSLGPIDEDELGRISKHESQEDFLKRKEEEHKYGIFFTDNYDYMQHLREVGSHQGTLEMSRGECKKTSEKILLNSLTEEKSVKQVTGRYIDLLPDAGNDIEIANDLELKNAMEESFDFNDPSNLLEDDFIVQADAKIGPDVFEEHNEDHYPGLEENDGYVNPDLLMDKSQMVDTWVAYQNPETELEDTVSPQHETEEERKSTAALIKQWVTSNAGIEPGECDDSGEERRSHFSNFSMTSSVMRRSNELRLLDDRFEKMFRQYDEEEIGALDMEDHVGNRDHMSDLLRSLLHGDVAKEPIEDEISDVSDEPDEVALRYKYEGAPEEPLKKLIIKEADDKFDCQSVISLRSNNSFQPRILDLPRKVKPIILDPKTGIPKHSSNDYDDSTESSSDNGSDILSLISSLSVPRPKNETAEERNLRKHTLKELRRERRKEKKNSRILFRNEKMRQEIVGMQHRLKTIDMA